MTTNGIDVYISAEDLNEIFPEYEYMNESNEYIDELGEKIIKNVTFTVGDNDVRMHISSNPPSLTSDINSGFKVGSRWLDVMTHEEYVCTDNTENAAVWVNSQSKNEGDHGGGMTHDLHDNGVHTYNFALYPEAHQPSGTMNEYGSYGISSVSFPIEFCQTQEPSGTSDWYDSSISTSDVHQLNGTLTGSYGISSISYPLEYTQNSITSENNSYHTFYPNYDPHLVSSYMTNM